MQKVELQNWKIQRLRIRDYVKKMPDKSNKKKTGHYFDVAQDRTQARNH